MTSAKDRRHELIDALVGAGVDCREPGGDPPYVAVFPNGRDPRLIVSGRIEASWRVTAVGGAWDTGAAVDSLDLLVSASVAVLRGLATFQIGTIDPAAIAELGGSRLLVQNIICTSLVDV